MSGNQNIELLIKRIDELLKIQIDSLSEDDIERLNSARNILTGVHKEIKSKHESVDSDNPIGTGNIDLIIKITEAIMLLAKFMTE